MKLSGGSAYWVENTPLAPSENRSHKSADGRVATEAAWLHGKDGTTKERALITLDLDRPSHGRHNSPAMLSTPSLSCARRNRSLRDGHSMPESQRSLLSQGVRPLQAISL